MVSKKVSSLIRLSQTYPSPAAGNHPMARTDFFFYFHQPSYTLISSNMGTNKNIDLRLVLLIDFSKCYLNQDQASSIVFH